LQKKLHLTDKSTENEKDILFDIGYGFLLPWGLRRTTRTAGVTSKTEKKNLNR